MANSIFLGPNVPQTINGTLTVNGSVTLPGAADFIAFGAAPSTVGELRFSNADAIYFRNGANTANLRILTVDASNNVVVSGVIAGGPLFLDGTTAITMRVSGTAANIGFNTGNALFSDIDNTLSLGTVSLRWIALHLSSFAAIGTTPANAGAIRLANTAKIIGRNAANSADLDIIQLTSANTVAIGSTTVVSVSNLASTSFSTTIAGVVQLTVNNNAVYPGVDNSIALGFSSQRWLYTHLSESIRIGTNPAVAGTVRVQHNASIAGRNSTNAGDLRILDWGVVANNEARFGDPAVNNRICSLLTTPTTLSNGDWWVECSGVSPARVAEIKVRDGGATRTIATSVAY